MSVRMPPCVTCGHSWSLHIIPGGIDNIDIYPTERHCAELGCNCKNYVRPTHEQRFQGIAQRLANMNWCIGYELTDVMQFELDDIRTDAIDLLKDSKRN